MRRTVLRDRASRRLISRRLCPCACRVRTAVRISVGVMRTLSQDLVDQRLDSGPQTGHGVDQRQGQRTQSRQTLPEARKDRLDAAQVSDAFAFRSVAQALTGTLPAVLAQGVEEQTGMADHAFTGATQGFL